VAKPWSFVPVVTHLMKIRVVAVTSGERGGLRATIPCFRRAHFISSADPAEYDIEIKPSSWHELTSPIPLPRREKGFERLD